MTEENIKFLPEDNDSPADQVKRKPWKILIVDDEELGHQAITNALKDFSYRGESIEFYHAYNSAEAKEVLAAQADCDVIFLDIIMDYHSEGLDVINHVRKTLENLLVRIVIITASSREYPEVFLRNEYEIDNYLSKEAGDLVRTKIRHTVKNMLAIRQGFREQQKLIDRLDHLVVERTGELQNLVHILCHDLSNPLSVIIACVYVFKNHECDASELKEFSNKIERAANIQREIIGLVRESESIRVGKLEFKLEPVNIGRALEDACFIFEKNLQEKSLRLEYDSALANTLFVLAERRSLANQVINNVISNAIKFSPDGSTISINFESADDLVRISIKDQGIGIPDNVMQSIFDLSMPTSRLGVRGEMGSGLGMPLVKSYMNIFGGDVEIQTKTKEDDPVNHGTTTTLILKRSA